MSMEDFESMDNEAIDISIIKRDFLDNYQQQAANLNDCDQNIEFIFSKNNNYHQTGYSYLHFEITVEKDVANIADRIPADGDDFRSVKKALAYCFKEVRLSTMGGSDIEYIKYCGNVSTIMRAVKLMM